MAKGAKKGSGKAASGVSGKVPMPSPNPMTNLILADVALRAGGALLRRSVEKGLIGTQIGQKKAGRVIRGRSMMQTLVGTALARLATRSVPGAIVVGGTLVAKSLYDRKQRRKVADAGADAVDDQARRGDKT